jgi:TonB family protein
LLAGLAFACSLNGADSDGADGYRPPVLTNPLFLNIPQHLWHLSDSWEVGYMRLRIGPDGTVLDWIPIDLPHYDLVGPLDSALKRAVFTKPLVNGTPVSVDIPASIPLYDVIGNDVISVNMSEHIEGRMAKFPPGLYQLVVSSHAELDKPLQLVSAGDSYNMVDEQGITLSGTVVVDFYIDTKGFPRMMVAGKSANRYLAQAAVMTIANMQFSPPTRKNRPTIVKARMPVVLGD